MPLDKNKKIKICCIVSADMTLKFMLFNQLKFLQKEGYDVYTICSSGKWVEDIKEQGIKVKIMAIKRKMSPVADLIFFWKMFLYFRKEKFDIVHTHTLKPEFYGQIAAKLAGVPIIINTLHGFDFAEDSSAHEKLFFITLEKIAAKCSSSIFSISRKVITAAIKNKICRQNLIKYLGRDIDTERFNLKRFSSEFILQKKKRLGIDRKKRIIGIVARLVAEKGYLELFEAFKIVIAKFPETILLVIGPEEPEKKDAIKTDIVKQYGIEKNAVFLGERTDVDELYPLMDIFVLPTHREGIGASILEASAMERPIIATNTGGCPEAVDNNKTGILVSVKNPEQLAQAIIYLLENPKVAKKMGEQGKRKILNEFDKKIVFDRLLKEYKRLIELKKI